VRSNSGIIGPYPPSLDIYCRAPGSQTAPALCISSSYDAGSAPSPSPGTRTISRASEESRAIAFSISSPQVPDGPRTASSVLTQQQADEAVKGEFN
jgi:hypothetical protein